jgi:DNA (cytosine-5)-methyltransferase 1
MSDGRNHLFWEYKKLIAQLKPDGFLFENVTGLLNMDGGSVYRLILDELSSTIPQMSAWVLAAEEYGIPQRRRRVFLVGTRGKAQAPPQVITSSTGAADLFGARPPAITAEQAIGDLPALLQGEDGSAMAYGKVAQSPYQRLMRGEIDAITYLQMISQP